MDVFDIAASEHNMHRVAEIPKRESVFKQRPLEKVTTCIQTILNPELIPVASL